MLDGDAVLAGPVLGPLPQCGGCCLVVLTLPSAEHNLDSVAHEVALRLGKLRVLPVPVQVPRARILEHDDRTARHGDLLVGATLAKKYTLVNNTHMNDLSQSKAQKISVYDPTMVYANNGLFGLPFTNDESEVVLLPVPWEVTVSYRHGTAAGPKAMADSSAQVDLFDADLPAGWQTGIGMEKISSYWQKQNKTLRPLAEKCIAHVEDGGKPTDTKIAPLYKKINAASSELNAWVKTETSRLLAQGKLVGVVGGEHSVSLGLMQALGEKYDKFSVLHLDAHADYRVAFEGFEFSHASIQYNAGKIKQIEKQVLLSIRDYSHQEVEQIAQSAGKVVAFPDRDLKRNAYNGLTWAQQCEKILTPLGQNVYISFDIDALDPKLCPHTGTPVPGGLEFEQVFFLLEALIKAGKKIIGFDLCEVAPGVGGNGEWDAIVGARALFRLSLLMAKSHGRI